MILRNLSYCASKSADGTLQYRRVRGNNNKNKKKRPYITYIFGQTLSYCRFVSVFKLWVCLNCTKCYRNRLRGFDFVWVEFWPFPYKCMSLLTQCVNYSSHWNVLPDSPTEVTRGFWRKWLKFRRVVQGCAFLGSALWPTTFGGGQTPL